MLRFTVSALAALLLAAAAGCGRDSQTPGPGAGDEPSSAAQHGAIVERPDNPPVSYVEGDDPQMTAAINQARATVDQFIAALKNPTDVQADFSVKLPVVDGDQVEHMWLSDVRYADGRFTGQIANEPLEISTVALGDDAEVAADQISDWMYVDDGRLMGGYTIRRLRDSMPPDQRHEFDQSVPFTFD
jgi:uncharacterized protein YegJ (DUF2314 family)